MFNSIFPYRIAATVFICLSREEPFGILPLESKEVGFVPFLQVSVKKGGVVGYPTAKGVGWTDYANFHLELDRIDWICGGRPLFFFTEGIQMIQLYMSYPQKGFLNEPSIEGDYVANQANHQDLKAHNK